MLSDYLATWELTRSSSTWQSAGLPGRPARPDRRPTQDRRRLGSDADGDGDPVPALGADGLQNRAVEPGVVGEHLQEATDADSVGVRARFEHTATAHDVVPDDEAADAGQPGGPVEVLRVRRLVRVDEDEVEGLPGQRGQGVQGPADADLDDVLQAGAGEVGAGDVGVLRRVLECDEPAAGNERSRQPDGAVAAQ